VNFKFWERKVNGHRKDLALDELQAARRAIALVRQDLVHSIQALELIITKTANAVAPSEVIPLLNMFKNQVVSIEKSLHDL